MLRYVLQLLQDRGPSIPCAALITGRCDYFHSVQEDLALIKAREQKLLNLDPDPVFRMIRECLRDQF